MLKSKELRVKAWESLKGGKFIPALVASFIIGILISLGSSLMGLASEILGINETALESGVDITGTLEIGFFVILGISLSIAIVGFIAFALLQGPALIGECNYFIKNTEVKPSIADVFSGFKTKYGRNVWAMLVLDIKLSLWTLLFVIPGIIKSFEYAIIPYILADDAEISTKDSFKKAKEMMTGNKWRLFKLNFSFIGWYILVVAVGTIATLIAPVVGVIITTVATLLLVPYLNAANAEFYAELKNK